MSETEKHYASDIMNNDRFASSVSFYEHEMIIGAYFADAPYTNCGAAYVYELFFNPELSHQPTNPTVYRGQEIEVTAEISEATNVIGYRIGVNYNPAVIKYVSGSATIAGTSCALWYGPFVNDASATGQLICTAASEGDPLGAGPGSLLKFRMLVDDDSSLADGTIIDVTFSVETNNPALFAAGPAINPTGTLSFTTALNANGVTEATVVMFDSGGTENGGIHDSAPYNFIISVTAVNDAPSFIPGATPTVLEDAGPQTLVAWATGIIAGQTDENWQELTFDVQTTNPSLFSATPAIDATGTLTFTSAPDAFGIADVSATLRDNGGTLNGGINKSFLHNFIISVTPVNDVPWFIKGATIAIVNDPVAPREYIEWATEEFKIISFAKYLWGDMNDNSTVGSVDASLVLQYDVGTISYFPAFPPSEYPEYYQQNYVEYFPAPVEDDPIFTPAGDVNWDQTIATVDASLILQQYALLIDYFPADTNEDDWGPDYVPGGKLARRERTGYVVDRELSASVIAGPDGKSWVVRFAVDDASGLCGVKVGVRFDASQVAVVEEDACLLVNDRMSLVATNASQEGLFVLAGALGVPIGGSLTHPTELLSLRFKWIGNYEPSGSVLIEVDEGLTRLNDGGAPLSADSVKVLDLLSGTAVSGWMVY